MYKLFAVMFLVLLATGASAAPLRMMLTTQALTAAQEADVVSQGGRPGPDWCWDGTGNRWVSDTTTLSCTRGGTRMCDKGNWRVLNGQCTGQVVQDENGNDIVIVTTPNPFVAPKSKP